MLYISYRSPMALATLYFLLENKRVVDAYTPPRRAPIRDVDTNPIEANIVDKYFSVPRKM